MHFWYKKGYISFHGFCILSFEFLSIPTVFAIRSVLIRFRLLPDEHICAYVAFNSVMDLIILIFRKLNIFFRKLLLRDFNVPVISITD